MLLRRRLSADGGEDEDLSPASSGGVLPTPLVEPLADEGPVMVTVSTFTDPTRAADDFVAVMEETRRARLRQGALVVGFA